MEGSPFDVRESDQGVFSKKTVRIGRFLVHTGMRRKQHIYHVYIMANRHNTVLYTGMTGRVFFRIAEHIENNNPGFTNRYSINKLVYLERFTEVADAISREKQIKRWSRKKKVWLVEKYNLGWVDLFEKYTRNGLISMIVRRA